MCLFLPKQSKHLLRLNQIPYVIIFHSLPSYFLFQVDNSEFSLISFPIRRSFINYLSSIEKVFNFNTSVYISIDNMWKKFNAKKIQSTKYKYQKKSYRKKTFRVNQSKTNLGYLFIFIFQVTNEHDLKSQSKKFFIPYDQSIHYPHI